MNPIELMLQVAKTNFFEQIRRDKFFLTMLAILALIVAIVPPPNANHSTITMGEYRLLYNSAWIGTIVAVITSVILALTGFYLIRGTVTKDRDLGIRSIMTTQGSGRLSYLFGKYLSNIGVLFVLMIAAMLVAVILQLKFGEEKYIHIMSLISPFIIYTIPTILIISALSIIFEIVPGLRGVVGSIFYIVVWAGLLSLGMPNWGRDAQSSIGNGKDFFGISQTLTQITSSIETQHREYSGTVHFGLQMSNHNAITKPVQFEGNVWELNSVLNQLGWMGFSLFIMSFSGVLFFRFDVYHLAGRRLSQSGVAVSFVTIVNRITETLLGWMITFFSKLKIFSSSKNSEGYEVTSKPKRKRRTYREEEIPLIFPVLRKFVLPFASTEGRHGFEVKFRVELKHLAKNTPWWWYLILALLIVMCPFAPMGMMQGWLLPLCWLLPLLIWSNLGLRASAQFRENAPNKDIQQDFILMQVLWSIGVLVAMVAGSGAAIRFIIEGEWRILTIWMISVAFIPSLAFVLSMWTTSIYAFEGTYVLLWLVNSISKNPVLDFMGSSSESFVVQNPTVYLLWTCAIICFAAVGSQRLLERREPFVVAKQSHSEVIAH